MKEFNIKLREVGTGSALDKIDPQLAAITRGFQSGKIAGDEAFSLITARLAAIEDPIAQRAAGVALFGTKFEDLGEDVILAMGQVDQSLITSAGAVDQAGSKITSLGEIFPRVFGALGTALLPANDAILGFVNDNLPQMETFVGTIQSAFTGQLPGAIQVGQAAFQQAQAIIAPVMAGIQAVVTAVLSVVMAFWQQNGASIMATVQTTWNQIVQIITVAGQLIGAVLQIIAGFIATHGSEIVGYLTAAWNLISSIITTALSLVQGIITAALQLIQGDFSGAWQTIQQTSATFVTNLVRVIENGATLMRRGIDLGIAAIREAWGALVRAAPELGSSVMSGIVRGVSSGVGALVSAVTSAAKRALDAAKRALGIQSPSSVFAAGVGLPIAQGMAQGIMAGAPLVRDAGLQLAGAAAGGSSTTTTWNINMPVSTLHGQRADQFGSASIDELQRRVALRR
jgi:phage-related protein